MLLLDLAPHQSSLVECKYSIRIYKHRRDVYHCIVLDMCFDLCVEVRRLAAFITFLTSILEIVAH